MTYQFPLSSSNQNKTVVVDIVDDEDVEVFIDMAVKTSHGLVTLYVVEPVTSRPDESVAGNNEGKHSFTFQHLFPEHKPSNAAGTSKNPTQVLESQDEFGDERDFVHDQKESSYGPKEVSPLKHPGSLDVDDGNPTLNFKNCCFNFCFFFKIVCLSYTLLFFRFGLPAQTPFLLHSYSLIHISNISNFPLYPLSNFSIFLLRHKNSVTAAQKLKKKTPSKKL